MVLATRFTTRFGIQVPVMQGGMQWIGYAGLAAAVSNAGGLGVITALTQPSPQDLYDEVRRCHELTGKPFGVNITTLPSINPPPYDEYRSAAIDAGVSVVETSGSNPAEHTRYYQDAGVKVIDKATSVKHALKAQSAGVDAVIVDGFECAGHPGEDDIPGLVLIPVVADHLHIPVLAAGGIADGRGLAAALALGADGVVMGTRFTATEEALVHLNVKGALVRGDEHQTNLIFRELRNTARVAKNSASDKVVQILGNGGDFQSVKELVAGKRGKTVYASGDIDAGIWWAGLSQALIHDTPSCENLIRRTVAEAEEVITSRLGGVIVGASSPAR